MKRTKPHKQYSSNRWTPKAAIPTDYNGTTFRSRLEAKWASFFDLLGWPWQYEPVDLLGYIPDFILPLKLAPVLVEVKPCFYLGELERYKDKIITSGWEREVLIVGTDIFKDEYGQTSLGLLREISDGIPYGWASATFNKCPECSWSFFHSEGSYRCRVCGAYDGNRLVNPIAYEEGRRMFATASAIVQYKP